jgi:hypothetical protein
MSAAYPAWLEVIDFQSAGFTPKELIAFRPSPAVQDRISDLLVRNQEGTLSSEEQSELDDFVQLEHLLIMAKAQAHRHVDIGG